MGGQCTLRIDPARLGNEADSGEPEPVDRILLLGRKVPFEPNEGTVRGQFAEQLAASEVGQHARDAGGRGNRVDQLARIGVERGGPKAGRQKDAVAVDDIGARHGRRTGGADVARRAALQHRDLDQTHRKDQAGNRENTGDRQ